MAADVIELKDQIKKLKARKAEILSERSTFEQELLEYESKLNDFKQELNVVGALDELRFAVVPSGDGNGGSVLNAKEQEMNRKLELQFLIPDIKASLPILESQALEWEENAHTHDMEFIRIEADGKTLPQTILRSSQEIREEIESVLDRLLMTKALVARDVEEKKQIKLSMANDIRHLRDQLRMAEDDVGGVHMRALKSEMSYKAEEARVDVLAAEQSRLRSEICSYYSDDERGWQTEAFVAQTGSVDDPLPMEQVAGTIALWLPPTVKLNSENLMELLDSMGVRTSFLDLDTFCALCVKVVDGMRAKGANI